MSQTKISPKPGDVFLVKIGSHRVKTVIDESGVQRLPNNSFYDKLIQTEVLDLNKMKVAYLQKQLSFDEYLDFYLNIGYSVSGFAELSAFQHLDISNPLWD